MKQLHIQAIVTMKKHRGGTGRKAGLEALMTTMWMSQHRPGLPQVMGCAMRTCISDPNVWFKKALVKLTCHITDRGRLHPHTFAATL